MTTPAILLPLMPAARVYATRDVEARYPLASPGTREDLISSCAEALACSAHLRRMTVADYVERFAPELVERSGRRAA